MRPLVHAQGRWRRGGEWDGWDEWDVLGSPRFPGHTAERPGGSRTPESTVRGVQRLYWCTTPVAASRSAGAVPAIARPVVGRSRSRMRLPPSVPVRGVQRLVWNRRLRRSSAMVRPLLRANARNARAFLRPFRTKGLRSNRAHPSIGTGYFAPCRVRSPRYRFEAEIQARLAAPVSTTARQARGRLGRPAAPAGGRHDLPRSFCR